MMLLLDIGNSRLKSATWDGQVLRAGVTQSHGGDPAAALASLSWEGVKTIWITHVTGAEHEQRMTAAVQAQGLTPHYARTETQRGGLRNAYQEPLRLGIDRWLAMVGAWTPGQPVVVADAGTALTVDLVQADGQHLGGFIAPGLLTMQQAVLGATRFATRDMQAHYHDGVARETEGCVRQGAFLSCLGAVDRVAAQLPTARKIITGGDAAALLPHLPGWEHRSLLVLEGLLRQANQCL